MPPDEPRRVVRGVIGTARNTTKGNIMGMDVFGTSGNYFRRSVWGWRPLADFCIQFAPSITAACEHWHTNDGDGLDETGATALADVLDAALADGRAQSYVAIRDAEIAALPRKLCHICQGSGVRTDKVGRDAGQDTRVIDTPGHPRYRDTGWCNGCDGLGTVPSYDTFYRLDVTDIAEFAAFLRACGGFQIC